MKFRVTLVRRKPWPEFMPRNPFLASIDVLKPVPCTATYRTWEFEARSERAVRRLLKEAREQNLPVALDPFAGSGALLDAAYRKGMRGVGFDVDELVRRDVPTRDNL